MRKALLWSPAAEAAETGYTALADAADGTSEAADEARLGEDGSEPLEVLRVTPEGENVHA